MAEITRSRVGELMRGVIKILQDHPDGLPAKDVLQKLVQEVPPSEFEKSDYPKRPGVRRFEKMARFATIGPVKAGWIVKGKGRWFVTEEGKKAFNQIQDPVMFAREASRLYRQWKESQPDTTEQIVDDGPETVGTLAKDADVASTVEEAEENAWSQIEQYVQTMNPYDLQRLVAA